MEYQSRLAWLKSWIENEKSMFAKYLDENAREFDEYMSAQAQDAKAVLEKIKADHQSETRIVETMTLSEWQKVLVESHRSQADRLSPTAHRTRKISLTRPSKALDNAVKAGFELWKADALQRDKEAVGRLYDDRLATLRSNHDKYMKAKTHVITAWFNDRRKEFRRWYDERQRVFQQALTSHDYYREYSELKEYLDQGRPRSPAYGQPASKRSTAVERVMEYNRQDDYRQRMMGPTVAERIRDTGPTIAEQLRPKNN